MNCPACGTPAPDGARFCYACGLELEARGDERRVATVLFGDLVGFTTLSESRDPEQVKLIVDGCFEALVRDIHSFGGRVDKIIGDAIVALFGAPVAHEDDPERAVRAALRMQQTMTDRAGQLGATIEMRIGVNTGEVLVGALRAGGDYTAMGDVVNTASRLQTAAAPGQVLVGPATHAATDEVIVYEPVGALEVRGRGDRVEAWRAVSATVPPGYRRRHTRAPLIGREAELGLIGHAIDTAADRNRAAVITLLGEAGVGKSRLAREVAEMARQQRGAAVIEGRCVPYGEANVWWPVAQAVRGATGVTAELPGDEVASRVTGAVAASLDRDPSDPDVSRLANGLLHLMGVQSPLADIDPHRAREEVTRSVIGYLEALLDTAPVMLVVSDLHWAGGPVLELLAAMLDQLADRPLMVLATARPPFKESWVPADARHNTLTVNVDPLGREATAALLDALVDERIDPELRSMLLDRSGGNPFFLEELVALVDERAGLAELGDTSGSPDDLPDTLRGLVAARLDGLTRTERLALEDATVYGRSGPVDALVLMARADRAGQGVRDEDQVRAAVDGLVDKEILVLDEQGETYTFRSALAREVAYSTLTKTARALRHWGIGQYLENNFVAFGAVNPSIVDGLAHHYGQTAELVLDIGGVPAIPDDIVDRALRWIGEAARHAEAGEVHLVAERLFSQALGLLPASPSPERVTTLLGRARARAEMRRLAVARLDVEEAVELAEQLEDRSCRARAILIRGTIEDREGDRTAAIATFTEALDEFAAVQDRRGVGEALRLRGMVELFAGDAPAAHRSISDALDLFGALGDKRGQAWALQNLAWLAFLEGRPTEADRRISESAAMFSELGDGGGLGWALGLQAWVRFHQGAWEEAESLSDSILSEARRRGDRWAEGMMLVLGASVRLWTGRADSAIAWAHEAVEVFHSAGDVEREVQSAAVLGRALLATGLVGEAFRTLDLAIDTERTAVSGGNGLAPTAVAAAAVSVGDPERALRAAALVGIDDLDPSVIGESDRLVALGLALLQLGRAPEARDHLSAAVTPAGDEEPSGYALSAQACVLAVDGDVDGVRTLVAEVLAIGRATYLDRVTALVALGAIERGLGRRAEADAAFDQAVALADSTDDRVAQALARLARCEASAAAGEVLVDLASDVQRRLSELGIEASGWIRVFRGAALAGAEGSPTPSPV
ncbi:MAG: adenylate/guanylate cyclase domain-containing protein [Acidimicrobiales bacterium]